MFSVVVLLLLGLVGVFSARDNCPSKQYTGSGECCKLCPPGEGMVKPCGKEQTQCEPCMDSETFSENFSHTERCTSCTRCEGLLRMDVPCTETNDAVCICDYGYFLSSSAEQCQVCKPCPVGSGVLYQCKPDQDTVCELCQDDTFSDQESTFDPCLPCKTCEEQGELVHCTNLTDTICQDNPDLQSSTGVVLSSLNPSTPSTPSFNFTDFTSDSPPETTESTVMNEPKKVGMGLGDNLMPLYISIVPAVLLSLVAFIIIKRCKTCKHNKQDDSNRSGTTNPTQTPSPEGEKLHSDSGISVDSQSLQEGQGHTVVKIDGGLNLPLHACEELEKLLDHEGQLEGDWSSLAGLLGYEEERIACFGQEERPIQALLSDWASHDSASVDTLCAALRKINREDLALSITPKCTATSAV